MVSRASIAFLRLAYLCLSACTVFDHEIEVKPACETNSECNTKLGEPAMCITAPTAHCAALTSDDCTTITGDPTDDRAVLIGTLLQVTGTSAATNLPRQQSAIMAVEEINASNASGGILESSAPGDTRKLVALSCDAAVNLPRAATHLLTDLHVAAIVGPNLSQDVLDLTTGNSAIGLPSSAQSGTALFPPAAVASAIETVPDNGLTFMMVPSDSQRVPLLKLQIGALEAQLKTARSKSTIKFAVWYRSDALGEGTAAGLNSLTINNMSLASAINAGNAREDTYAATSTDNSTLVAAYAAFQPDIIVVAGTAEITKYFITPLEAAWPTGVPRPYYLGIDSIKTPELLTAVTGNNDLRLRVRGTGITTNTETAPVFSAFQIAYGQRWKDASGNPQPATTSSMGPTYDAVYTIALALVGQTDTSGKGVIAGIHALATNTDPCTYDGAGVVAPCFTVSDHVRTLYNNMGTLLQKKPVTEIGTSSRLEWDAQGNKPSGLIEMWCIDGSGSKPIYASSGLTFDIRSQTTSGTYVQCAP
jgi:ABC-type branched-subunit amino acid transport system substrate-binding protein